MVKAKDANVILAGSEPAASKVDAKSKQYKIEFIKALNWYAMNKSPEDARKYLLTAATLSKQSKERISGIKNLKDGEVPLAQAWCIRLASRGAKLDKKHLAAVADRMSRMFAYIDSQREINAVKDAAKDPAKKAKSIQEYMAVKIQEFLGECEGIIDQRMEDPDYMADDKAFYKYLQGKEIPQAYVPAIVEWCDTKIKEFGEVLLSKDDQVKEGYSNFSKKALGNWVKFFASMKAQANQYAQFKKVNKAPRKRKAKPPAVVAAKVKYKVSDEEYKLKSVFPADVVEAEQLWTFNTKTRVLAVYRASGSQGLSFKGTTVINFDIESSEQKRLRKPVDTLAKLEKAGKVELRKLLDGVKAVSHVPNGRINKDIILVRVIR